MRRKHGAQLQIVDGFRKHVGAGASDPSGDLAPSPQPVNFGEGRGQAPLHENRPHGPLRLGKRGEIGVQALRRLGKPALQRGAKGGLGPRDLQHKIFGKMQDVINVAHGGEFDGVAAKRIQERSDLAAGLHFAEVMHADIPAKAAAGKSLGQPAGDIMLFDDEDFLAHPREGGGARQSPHAGADDDTVPFRFRLDHQGLPPQGLNWALTRRRLTQPRAMRKISGSGRRWNGDHPGCARRPA